MTSLIKQLIARTLPQMHALGTDVVLTIAGVDYAIRCTHDDQETEDTEGRVLMSEEILVDAAALPAMPFDVDAILIGGKLKSVSDIRELGARLKMVITERPRGGRNGRP